MGCSNWSPRPGPRKARPADLYQTLLVALSAGTAAEASFALSDASFNSRDSFSTRCRMILPALNFTVARGGITKLLPGSFGLRPTRGLVRRG